MMLSIALAALTGTAQPAAQPPRAPLAETEYVVLVPAESYGSDREALAEQARRVLITLDDLNLLEYHPTRIPSPALQQCVQGDSDPTAERRECLRRLLSRSTEGVPVVGIVLGYTPRRSAAQQMECVGPRHEGFLRSVYVDQAFHQNREHRAGIREQVRRCIEAALGGRPTPRR